MLESESDILVEGLQKMAAVRACRGLAEPQEQVGLTFLAYLFVFLFLKIHERHPISAQLLIFTTIQHIPLPQYFLMIRLLYIHMM